MFVKIKNDILGKDYSLSIAMVAEAKSRELNKKYRKKDKATNVLSFALTKNSGELILCPTVIKVQAKDKNKNFGKKYPELLQYLVIHGMLHLKGYQHSSRMEKEEEFYCKKYQPKNDAKHFSRNRRGLEHDKGGRGRISKRRKKS